MMKSMATQALLKKRFADLCRKSCPVVVGTQLDQLIPRQSLVQLHHLRATPLLYVTPTSRPLLRISDPFPRTFTRRLSTHADPWMKHSGVSVIGVLQLGATYQMCQHGSPSR